MCRLLLLQLPGSLSPHSRRVADNRTVLEEAGCMSVCTKGQVEGKYSKPRAKEKRMGEDSKTF